MKKKQVVIAGLCAFYTLLIVMFITDAIKAKEIISIKRPSGSLMEKYELTAVCEGKKVDFIYELGAKPLNQSEVDAILDASYKEVIDKMLGSNESLDEVLYDLDLVSVLPKNRISVEWQIKDGDVINHWGEITPQKEDAHVCVETILTCKKDVLPEVDTQKTYYTWITVKAMRENFTEDIIGIINDIMDQNIYEEEIILPSKYNGKDIYFYSKKAKSINGGLVALGLTPIIYLLFMRVKKEDKLKKEKETLLSEYPNIVTKLSLLINSGMTSLNALKRIAADSKGLAYDKLQIIIGRIESGSYERVEYAKFGKEFGLPCYYKLGMLLEQNLTKGNRFMKDMLRLEAIEALENRKNRAKKEGEKASTKLIFPMLLLLMDVLIIILVPAYLSI